MIYNKCRIIRSFFRRPRDIGFGDPAKKITFLLLAAALFSSIANAQLPTVTALPYVLANDGFSNVVVATNYPVAPVPKAVGVSGFGSLMGGGFGSLLTAGIGVSAEAAATAVTIAGLRKASIVRSVNFIKAEQARLQADAEKALADKEARYGSCNDTPNAIKVKRHSVSAHSVKAMDASTCTLPEEEEADEAEQELQQLNEAGNASQEALEGAEEAAEAAEVAAEAAEEAAEAAEIGIDILEGVIDACGLF